MVSRFGIAVLLLLAVALLMFMVLPFSFSEEHERRTGTNDEVESRPVHPTEFRATGEESVQLLDLTCFQGRDLCGGDS